MPADAARDVYDVEVTSHVPPTSAHPGTSACAPVVYFDGACPVCAREIAMYRQQPGGNTLRWVDASSCADDELGPALTREAALARLHLRGPDGQLVSGAAAFTGMWRQLPRWRWLGVVLGRGWRLVCLEGAYRAFLLVRRGWRRA